MHSTKEIWKKIEILNLRGEYYISNLGRVKRVKIYKSANGKKFEVNKDYIMKPFDNGTGYKVVSFHIQNGENIKRKNYYVHRLVAMAFIENPYNKPEVNHKNYERGDNRADNLEWCTDKENTNYSVIHITHPRSDTSGIRFKNGKYEVNVYHNRKQYYCGRYLEYDEALNARNKKLKELGAFDEKHYSRR